MNMRQDKRILNIDCTDYNKETLFLGYASDVNSTILHFILPQELLNMENTVYQIVFDRSSIGDSVLVPSVDPTVVGNGIEYVLPPAITYYSQQDNKQGHQGFLQLFVLKGHTNNDNNNTVYTTDLVASSAKIPYIIEDSLDLHSIQVEDIDATLWRAVAAAVSAIQQFPNNYSLLLPNVTNLNNISSDIKTGQLFLYNNRDLLRKTSNGYIYIIRYLQSGASESTIASYAPDYIGEIAIFNSKIYIGTSTNTGGFKKIPFYTDIPTSLSSFTDDVGYALAADIPTIPTNISAFNNDAGYLTQHQDISGKANVVNCTLTEFNNFSNYSETTIYNVSDGITKRKIFHVPHALKEMQFSFNSSEGNNSSYQYRYREKENNVWGSWTGWYKAIPTNVSSFTNDAGYLTQHQDISGKMDLIPVLLEDDTTNIPNGQAFYYNGSYYIKGSSASPVSAQPKIILQYDLPITSSTILTESEFENLSDYDENTIYNVTYSGGGYARIIALNRNNRQDQYRVNNSNDGNLEHRYRSKSGDNWNSWSIWTSIIPSISNKMDLVTVEVPSISGATAPDTSSTEFTNLLVGQFFFCRITGNKKLFIKDGASLYYQVN